MKFLNSKKIFKNNKAQTAIEFILLTTITVSFTLILVRQLKSSQYLSRQISGPWSSLATMMEHGTWAKTSQAKAMNPYMNNRGVTLFGDTE